MFSISFILDSSGSMNAVRSATISGFNEYVDSIKKRNAESHALFTLTLFDTNVTTPISHEPLADVPHLDERTYVPNGMTALYDAVCTTIAQQRKRTSDEDRALVIIMTDGEENSSREYTRQSMTALIEQLEAKGNWTFVFLGANQDSYATAETIGVPRTNATNSIPSDTGVGRLFESLASSTSEFAQSSDRRRNAFFSDEDRASIEEDVVDQRS